MDTLSYME